MLYPPAQLLGINGILKFSKEILKWKTFSPEKLRLAGITNYFQISADGGTGGGIFRKMYGEFLCECAPVFQDERLPKTGQRFIQTAALWDAVGEDLWQLSQNGNIELLKKMSASIAEIYKMEKDMYLSLLEIIRPHLSE